VTAGFVIEPLAKGHDRSDFSCGNVRIDDYFRKTVSQDVDRGYARCQVAISRETSRIAGFYTLSAHHVLLNEIPEHLRKKLPRYPAVPAALIGWLARHSDYAGRGLGSALLAHAIETVHQAAVGAHAVIADPIDDEAAAFYAAHGFTALTDHPGGRHFLPIKTALELISRPKI
jgi:ribosomal protein S18 acetylase RimI-like enzyme